MSKKVDQVGVYRGAATETALQLSKNGNPMFVVNLRADERYIDDQTQLDFYLANGTITEAVPQWIDWSAYDETIRTYMTLFSRKSEAEAFSEENAQSSYQQVQTAFGWDGASFDDLQSGKFVDTNVLFRVKEEEDPRYGPVTVSWVDAFDANPVRELKNLNQGAVVDLNKLLKITKKKGPKAAAAAPAKPAAAKVKATTKAPAKVTTPTPAAAAPPVTEAAPAPVAETPAVAVTFTKEEAWADVFKQASTETPDTITGAWIAAVAEVSEERGIGEGEFTITDWATVHTTVLRDLGVAAAA